ncbi:MAG: hypothetical protein K8R21_14450 [Leptospira sp.]|nr:hypothetical protein [Leptospira sp.]
MLKNKSCYRIFVFGIFSSCLFGGGLLFWDSFLPQMHEDTEIIENRIDGLSGMMESTQDRIQVAALAEEIFLIEDHLPALSGTPPFEGGVGVGGGVGELISGFERLELAILIRDLRVNESISFAPVEKNVPVPDVLFADVLKFFSPDNRRKNVYRPSTTPRAGAGTFGHFMGQGMLNPYDLRISSFMLQDFHFTGVSDKERRYFALHNTSPPYRG